jgi:hypothetical protein
MLMNSPTRALLWRSAEEDRGIGEIVAVENSPRVPLPQIATLGTPACFAS